jgi:hypothetical protein
LRSETPDANQQDLPWNDSPADSEAPLGANEPAPAEVASDEDDDDVVDSATARFQDPYERDTLDQRLAEEVPDRPDALADGGVQLVAPEHGGGDVEVGAADPEDGNDRESDLSAEDSAVHVRDES